MAFRGRGRGGRGRGRGFGYDHPAKHAAHEDFPEIQLPEMTCSKANNEEKVLLQYTLKFEEFWKTSCYHLEKEAPKKKNEDKEIERFSDRKRKTHSKRESLALYLKLTSSNFPAELLHGSRRGQASNKKLRWDRDSDLQAFEELEKLEQTQTHKDGDKKAEKEGDDDEEQEEEEEAEQEESSDGDYNQNVEFDDDDDDWNQEEEAQEDYYD